MTEKKSVLFTAQNTHSQIKYRVTHLWSEKYMEELILSVLQLFNYEVLKQLWLMLPAYFRTLRLTGSLMSFRHDGGRKLPLAAGKTPMSCSNGLNCKRGKVKDSKLLSSSNYYFFHQLEAYRFCALLKFIGHVCNTFKVWGKWCIMEWIIPLPGSTALKSLMTKAKYS